MAEPRRSYHHGDLERALVAATRQLVERDGTARFSVAEACKMAGVSTGAPYRHFRDKDDILAAVKVAGFEELTARMLAARDDAANAGSGGAGGPLDEGDEAAVRRVSAIGKAYVAFALDWPETFALMFGGARLEVTPERQGDIGSAGHRCFNVLIDEVARFLGHSSSEFESRELSVMLWSFVHGVAGLARDRAYDAARIDVVTDRLVDRASRAVLAGVRGLAGTDRPDNAAGDPVP